MTEVKICGLTRHGDVVLACAFGASYVGFNFAAGSPRRITAGAARSLAREVPPTVSKVGVFVGESGEEIREAIEAAALDLVQIHRPLREEDRNLPRPVIAVSRVEKGRAAAPSDGLLAFCRMVLFDTGGVGPAGGTGVTFDWSVLEEKPWPLPVMLAGGLTPGNVGEAIARVRPAAVDVASGVESEPGIKDERKMRLFFEAVRRADARLQ